MRPAEKEKIILEENHWYRFELLNSIYYVLITEKGVPNFVLACYELEEKLFYMPEFKHVKKYSSIQKNIEKSLLKTTNVTDDSTLNYLNYRYEVFLTTK